MPQDSNSSLRPFNLGTMIQVAQLLTFIGGIIVVVFAVGRRDAVLQSLIESVREVKETVRDQTAQIYDVTREVAKIQGRINSPPD